MRNKKFIKVIFLKNLAFKAKESDIVNFFKDMNIAQIMIVKDNNGKSKGLAYVEF